MERLNSLSAEALALADHAHLLDGALGRALVYLGVALLIGIYVWRNTALADSLTRHAGYRYAAVLAGFIGAALCINAAVLEAAQPFGNADSYVSVTPTDYNRMLFDTAYGQAWLAFCLLLTAGIAFSRYIRLALLTSLGAAAALAASAHAGERGFQTFIYWSDLLHLVLALTWLGGMIVLALGRLGNRWHAAWADLRWFSRVALPLFLLTLLSGLLRLALQYWVEQGIGTIYLLMLGLKLLAIVSVIYCAARLRSLLGRAQSMEVAYDSKLSDELFFAVLLVLATALLTQLPPI